MLTKLLHFLVAMPWVYNLVQILAGRNEGRRQMKPFLDQTAGETVLEVGAGTGSWAEVLPPNSRYIWFDNDPQKLGGFRSSNANSLALLGDAAQLCIRDSSVGWALCCAVSHHLSDEEFRAFLQSLARVSRHGLVFMDALHRPDRWISNLLWKYDRGANPRLFEDLRPFIAEFFDIQTEKRFTIHHEYWVCTARPKY